MLHHLVSILALMRVSTDAGMACTSQHGLCDGFDGPEQALNTAVNV